MNATACAKLKMYSDLEHYLSTDPHASLQEREAIASEQDTFKVTQRLTTPCNNPSCLISR